MIKKVPNVSGLVTTTLLDTKIGEVENKIPNTSGLVTPAILDTKNGDVTGLVKKTDYNAKLSDIEKKSFTTSNYNKFMG